MFLVRHGQTVFNLVYGATRRDPGVADPALTPEGRRQAREVVALLAGHDIELILASPYTRAIETAEIVAAALAVPVRIEADIRERFKFSCDVGSPRSRLSARWPRYDFAHLDEVWWPAAEEDEAAFAARCRGFAARMEGAAARDRIAVITHWGVIRALTGERVQNGTLIRLARPGAEPGAEVVSPPDTC